MKKRMMLFLTYLFIGIGLVAAQTRNVTGVVTSADDGSPVVGASVLVKGTTLGTITDIDGKFQLNNVPASAKTIQVSFVGMKTQEVPVAARITVKLQSDTELLDEVVVTAMGISRDKKALGYAATSIKGDEIMRSKAVNPMSALSGKVAGLEVSAAPGPGSTQNVIIRGASSFGNNQPLYIVDGVPITNSQNRTGNDLNNQVDFGSGINAINPDDIADMTVLKGAAATALYGSRAANGVIMITTKSGQNTEGKVLVDYDGGLSLSQVGRLPKMQELFGQGWSGERALDENGNWGAPYDGKDRVWGNIVDNEQLVKPYVFLPSRVRDFYDTGINYKNALSLSGGNAKTSYFVSLSQNHSDGVIPTDQDSYNRYTISTRGSHQAGKLKVSTSVNFSTEKTKAVASGQGTSTYRSLYEIANDISIVDMKNYKDKFYNLNDYFTPYGVNPYYVLDEDGAVQNKNKIFGKFELEYEILKGLKASYRFGGDFETSTSETHISPIAFDPSSPNFGSSSGGVGNYREWRRQRVQMNHDLMLSYNTKLSEDFSLNAIAGWNVNERQYNYLYGEITSIDIPGFYNLVNSVSPSTSTQYKEQRRLIGAYLNADFGFRDYAYLTLTARNDWSSTLPKGKNSYFYPGATFSFLLSDFLQKQDISTGIMDFAKFRVAYGMTGNDTDPYSVYNRYVATEILNPAYPNVDRLKFPLDGTNSYTVSDQLGNEALKPELTREFEVGFETRFLKHRLGVEFSYYNRVTTDLISTIPMDPSSGYTLRYVNLGDVRNRGIELTISGTPIKTKDFSWDLTWNYSVNRNKVMRLDVPEINLAGFSGAGIYAVEGQPLGQFKMTSIKTMEIDGVQHPVVDGKGNIQPTTEEVFVGKDINEKYRMGLSTALSWKGISAFATLDFRYGGYLYSSTKQYTHWVGSSPETTMNHREPFIVPNSVTASGAENTTPVSPTAWHTFYSDYGAFNGDVNWLVSRSYLKLREVGLAYQLPANFISKLKLRNARLSFNVSNILLWTPKENQYIDPETTSFGNDISAKFGEFNANPTNLVYTFGLNIGF